jgi:hypothetical protein
VTTVVATVALGLGLIRAIGCFIAALFDRNGFGRPRDSEPRGWYVALLGLGVVACIAIPGWIAARAWGRAVGPYVRWLGYSLAPHCSDCLDGRNVNVNPRSTARSNAHFEHPGVKLWSVVSSLAAPAYGSRNCCEGHGQGG